MTAQNASPYPRAVLPFSRWSYDYFAIPSGVQVTWATHRTSCLYHATVDGQVALCGAGNLTDANFSPLDFDPAGDHMACENCLGLVVRKPKARWLGN